MNPLDILNTFTKVAPFFLIPITAYIISTIITRVLKKEVSKAYNYIIKRTAELYIVSIIPVFITIYSSITNITNIYILETINPLSSLLAIISFFASITLGIAILSMESERFVSPLIKEIENMNINNLGKVVIKLLDIISFILSIILVYSILLLTIFPTNVTLINIITNIPRVYLYIIIFDIISLILIIASSKRLKPNVNVGKI